MTLPAHELLLKLGEARERYRTAWRLMDFQLPEPATAQERKAPARFSYRLNRTDGRTLILSRYTQPEADQKILLEKLKLQLPDQPPPRITTSCPQATSL